MDYQKQDALVWAVMQEKTEEGITELLSNWYQCLQADSDFKRAVAFEIHMASGDWQKAKQSLEKAFGRYHPKYKSAIDVLMAAVQSERLIKARKHRASLDDLYLNRYPTSM